jgi:hypothetical protein
MWFIIADSEIQPDKTETRIPPKPTKTRKKPDKRQRELELDRCKLDLKQLFKTCSKQYFLDFILAVFGKNASKSTIYRHISKDWKDIPKDFKYMYLAFFVGRKF